MNESHSIPAATTYTIDATNKTTFETDLGVINASTGAPLQKVDTGSTPTTGQYSVSSGGTYTFAAADASTPVFLNYAYTSTTGNTYTVSAQLIGVSPTFQIDYATTYEGHQFYIRVFKAKAPKLSLAAKLTDFLMPEIDFSCSLNAANKVLMMSDGTTV